MSNGIKTDGTHTLIDKCVVLDEEEAKPRRLKFILDRSRAETENAMRIRFKCPACGRQHVMSMPESVVIHMTCPYGNATVKIRVTNGLDVRSEVVDSEVIGTAPVPSPESVDATFSHAVKHHDALLRRLADKQEQERQNKLAAWNGVTECR